MLYANSDKSGCDLIVIFNCNNPRKYDVLVFTVVFVILWNIIKLFLESALKALF